MSRYNRCFSGLFLLVFMNGSAGCAPEERERERLLLRQVMREESGCIQKKVYGFVNDPNTERVEVYFTSGRLKEVYFRKDGMLEGLRTVYFEDGNVYETGYWHNDNRVGEFRYYCKDGRLDCEQYYGFLSDIMEETR